MNQFFDRHKDIGLLLLRIFLGLRLIYGVADNIFSRQHMQEFTVFLQNHGFPFPAVCAVVSVYAQAICGLMILIGFKTRWAAAIMVINFLVALIFIHLANGDTVEVMTPALAMLFGSLCLLFTGGGKWGIFKWLKN